MDSAEGRGVLAEYLTGTIFGAVFIAIFAGFVASLNIFDPLALAMGSGVGSGSMMAAASGAIAAQQSPEVAKSVLTFAAASNLITTTVGTYFTLFISLPMAVWGYRLFEPVIGRTTRASSTSDASDNTRPRLGDVETEAPTLQYGGKALAWGATAVLSLVCDWIAHGTTPLEVCLEWRSWWSRWLPVMPCVPSLDARFRRFAGYRSSRCSSPLHGVARAHFAELSAKNDFLGVTTPMLTFAGLSIAKDVPAFRRLGWRIVLVSFVANAGTFLGATLVAQIFHI